jgi:methionine biosynthesis protein MetW
MSMLRDFVRVKYEIISKIVEPNSSVLDVGCDTADLHKFLKNSNYYGVDVGREKIERLREKGLKVFIRDINKDDGFSFGKKFDYIIFLDILEHLVDPAEAITKAKKVLKPDGKMIICFPNDYHILNKLRFVLNKNITKYPFWSYGHLHTFPIKTGKNFLEEQKLVILKEIVLYSPQPKFVPGFIKKFLAELFPNNFSRGIVYLVKFH